MTDWGIDAAAWEQILKTAGRAVDVLVKAGDALSRRKKATRPEEKRALDQEVDELQADLIKLAVALSEFAESNKTLWLAIVNMLGPMDAPEGERGVDKFVKLINMVGNTGGAMKALAQIVPDHARRIKALEERERGARVLKEKVKARARKPKRK